MWAALADAPASVVGGTESTRGVESGSVTESPQSVSEAMGLGDVAKGAIDAASLATTVMGVPGPGFMNAAASLRDVAGFFGLDNAVGVVGMTDAPQIGTLGFDMAANPRSFMTPREEFDNSMSGRGPQGTDPADMDRAAHDAATTGNPNNPDNRGPVGGTYGGPPSTSNEGTSNAGGAGPDSSYDRAEGGVAGGTSGATDGSQGGGEFARGGEVTRRSLFGRNPRGPDDGAGYLDVGEIVFPRHAVAHFGKKRLLNMIRESEGEKGGRPMKDVTPGGKGYASGGVVTRSRMFRPPQAGSSPGSMRWPVAPDQGRGGAPDYPTFDNRGGWGAMNAGGAQMSPVDRMIAEAMMRSQTRH